MSPRSAPPPPEDRLSMWFMINCSSLAVWLSPVRDAVKKNRLSAQAAGTVYVAGIMQAVLVYVRSYASPNQMTEQKKTVTQISTSPVLNMKATMSSFCMLTPQLHSRLSAAKKTISLTKVVSVRLTNGHRGKSTLVILSDKYLVQLPITFMKLITKT